ncbi:MAG TPA: hypothetical protein PK092_08175 [Chitinophagaceae bacterium]|nr:hypothetical protein [Chitinophagaceae bacterium]
MLQRKNQVLLSFLKVRAIVNGKEIYPLPDSKPVVIPVQMNNPRLVITDGYHISRPLKMVYKDLHTYCFKVTCAVSDGQLLGGFIGLAGMYLSGFYTGLFLLKILSFLPLVYLLLFYYLNRKDFFRLVPVLN